LGLFADPDYRAAVLATLAPPDGASPLPSL
jgi:hypothetical protein